MENKSLLFHISIVYSRSVKAINQEFELFEARRGIWLAALGYTNVSDNSASFLMYNLARKLPPWAFSHFQRKNVTTWRRIISKIWAIGSAIFYFYRLFFCLIIHFMTSACDLVYWYILMIRRFLVIKHLKREKALRPLDGWRCKSKWHAYDINQDAEHKPIIHFCLIWFGQFLLFLQI